MHSPQITEVTATDERQVTMRPIISSDSREIIIPLVKDSAFFGLLSMALHSLSDRLSSPYSDFAASFETLSQNWRLFWTCIGFLELNMFILNVKKVCLEHVNAEATCKILKNHAKRTAFPLPPSQEWNEYSQETSLVPLPAPNSNPNSTYTSLTTPFPTYPSSSTIISLLRILVQALSTTLLPVVPHIDDYSCINCTNIAFNSIECTQ
ncbi:hypothetical protein GYMLUDRAFT_920629 [Collybiopsis luxurians FD-317 M1]|uniref:Uncharacterized protein n=1 Tax=Collybiopsis luxurians FD-317 M1 TaxID=944289 RepID=A0A0D0AUA4_9AGAR|nr:hypothetical protein GYMLUDRAFT_920629 [Collybiopsis luxurians FD-317 M1]